MTQISHTYIAEGTLTVSSTSVQLTDSAGITQANIDVADIALITVHTDTVYYRLSAADATADTSSHKKVVDSEITLVGRNMLDNFRAIRATADATLKITLFVLGKA